MSFLFTFLLKSLLFLLFSIEISTFSSLFYWNLYILFTFLLKSRLSRHFFIEISTFSLLFYWNLYFLFTFLLKSLLSLYFSIEISTFSLLFYRNLYFLCTFILKSLLSLHFFIEISTFSLLFYRNLYVLFTFLLKSQLSYFSVEIPTFSLLFFWNLYFISTFLSKSLLSLYFSIEIFTFSSLLSLLSLYFSVEISASPRNSWRNVHELFLSLRTEFRWEFALGQKTLRAFEKEKLNAAQWKVKRIYYHLKFLTLSSVALGRLCFLNLFCEHLTLSHHNWLGSKEQLPIATFPRSQKWTWKTTLMKVSIDLHTYWQFSWIVACSARCINQLHRRIHACGSADYSATWHRNSIDIGGRKWRLLEGIRFCDMRAHF